MLRHPSDVKVHNDDDDDLFGDFPEGQGSSPHDGNAGFVEEHDDIGSGELDQLSEMLDLEVASSSIQALGALGATRRSTSEDVARGTAPGIPKSTHPPQMPIYRPRHKQDAANVAEVFVDNLRGGHTSQERDVPEATNVRAGNYRTGHASNQNPQIQHGNQPATHDSGEGAMFMPVTEVYKMVDRAVQYAIGSMKAVPQPSPTNQLRIPVEDDDVPPPAPRESVGRQGRPEGPVGARRNRDDSSSPSISPDPQGSVSDVFRTRRSNHSRTKLPPFLGKESWEVWINRFQDVAAMRGWNTERKLYEIIPLLQGIAGDFVYGQLTSEVRRDYDLLTQELTYRFRKVETRKTHAVKFSHRDQNNSETPQEFAADLKRLYDKAHPKRDKQTRTEDLLRRFLDGLKDGSASFHVEYVKEPVDIDEAVNAVISFVEAKWRPDEEGHEAKKRRGARAARSEPAETQNDDRAARLPGRPPKVVQETPEPEPTAIGPSHDSTYLAELKKMHEELQKNYTQLQARIGTLEQRPNQASRAPARDSNPPRGGPRAPPSKPPAPARNGSQQAYECFKCGQTGHFARGCMNYPMVMGQFQVSAPQDTNVQFSQRSNGSGANGQRRGGLRPNSGN